MRQLLAVAACAFLLSPALAQDEGGGEEAKPAEESSNEIAAPVAPPPARRTGGPAYSAPGRRPSVNPTSSGGGGGGGAPASGGASDAPAGISQGSSDRPQREVVRDGGAKEMVADALAQGSGGYAALMKREPYVGTPSWPCRYGEPKGPCTYLGLPLPPPPSKDGFQILDVAAIPYFGNTNHRAFPLRGRKLALRFKAKSNGPARFPVHFDSPNGFVERSAMEMFVAVSEKAGDYDVPKECIVTPDMLSNGWAGGAAHSVANIEIGVGTKPESGVCILKKDKTYYVNVVGDCSKHWSGEQEYARSVARGCMTDLVEVNGWIQAQKQ